MKLTVLASATLCLGVGLIASAQAHFGHKLDDAQCCAAWAKASPNGDPIGYTQAEPYIVSFLITDQDQDGMISAEEFKKGCGLGLVLSPYDTISNEPAGAK